MTPEEIAALEQYAADLGVPVDEVLRLAQMWEQLEHHPELVEEPSEGFDERLMQRLIDEGVVKVAP